MLVETIEQRKSRERGNDLLRDRVASSSALFVFNFFLNFLWHPQVAFPFCLINSQEQAGLPGVSPALNHLRPGWVLSESMYMVIRSEDKYRRRAKARWAGLMRAVVADVVAIAVAC